MEKTELILALARCSFLTCAEKEKLAFNLDNLESLTVLSIEDICYKIGRSIRSRTWSPSLLPEQVHRDLNLMEKYDIKWVSVLSSGYPPLLREIHDSPFVIFWRGLLPDPEKPLVAIVGTRAPTGDGLLAALQLGREFADYGISVVSGLANGIDAYSHRGNIEGGCSSIAVLASGVDQIYPRSNKMLSARMIEKGGCILSEYPPGEFPLKYRFPQRNRIISGLARAVLVIEAPEKSGALITADFALEQGRDLYVYKPLLDSERGEGCRKLFEQGAPALHSASDLLHNWGCAANKRTSTVTKDFLEKDMISRTGEPGGISHSAMIGKQLAFNFRNELRIIQE